MDMAARQRDWLNSLRRPRRGPGVLLALVLLLAATAAAAAEPPAVTARATVQPARPAAGVTAELRVRVSVPPGTHINAAQPNLPFLVPTTLTVAAAGISAGTPRYPQPHLVTTAAYDSPVAVYDGAFDILVPLRLAPSAAGKIIIAAQLHYQLCDAVTCYAPAGAEAQVIVTVAGAENGASGDTLIVPVPAAAPPPVAPGDSMTVAAPVASGAAAPLLSLPLLFGLAFLGGMILNLMPCVLPVLALKVFSLVQQAQATRRQALLLGLAYTAGVLALFWLLAFGVIALRAAGTEVGWGFQFQNPYFVAAISAVVLVFMLALFGVIEISLSGTATTALAGASARGGKRGAFLSGAFATLLATPCTAPFLGAAMGFAFTQGSLILLLAFTAAGLGLAFPFLLLAVVPGARRWLPQPGMWMIKLKQGFGFLLLATLLWLLFVLGRQVSPDAAARAALWLLLAAFAFWLVADWLAPVAIMRKRLAGWLLALLVLGGGYALLLHPGLAVPAALPAAVAGWEPYSAARLQELRAAGRTVFVDVTAEWCLTCAVNHRLVLDTDGARELFRAGDVALLRADWTRNDPPVSELLRQLGRAGVPAYAVWHGEAPPRVLAEVLTFSELERGLAAR